MTNNNFFLQSQTTYFWQKILLFDQFNHLAYPARYTWIAEDSKLSANTKSLIVGVTE